MIWAYETQCSVPAEFLWQRWRDVANWRDWDPDIESSALQVTSFRMVLSYALLLHDMKCRRAPRCSWGPAASSLCMAENLLLAQHA
jgi:hypothetical protein